jgi:hypothetical protein
VCGVGERFARPLLATTGLTAQGKVIVVYLDTVGIDAYLLWWQQRPTVDSEMELYIQQELLADGVSNECVVHHWRL